MSIMLNCLSNSISSFYLASQDFHRTLKSKRLTTNFICKFAFSHSQKDHVIKGARVLTEKSNMLTVCEIWEIGKRSFGINYWAATYCHICTVLITNACIHMSSDPMEYSLTELERVESIICFNEYIFCII